MNIPRYIYISLLAKGYEERKKEENKRQTIYIGKMGRKRERDSKCINKIEHIHKQKAKFGHYPRSLIIRERIQTTVKRKRRKENENYSHYSSAI